MPVLQHGRSKFNHLMSSADISSNEHYSHSERHEQKYCAHIRIYASDNLVHWKKGCKNIVSEDDVQPILLRHSCKVLHEACRADHERHADCKKEEGDNDVHKHLHALSEVLRSDVRHIRTTVADRHHSGEEIMHSTHEDASYDNPDICCRSIGSTCHSTEDRSQTGDVKELDDKHLPCRHWLIINAVGFFISWSLSGRINRKKSLDNLSVNEIGCNQQQD